MKVHWRAPREGGYTYCGYLAWDRDSRTSPRGVTCKRCLTIGTKYGGKNPREVRESDSIGTAAK